MQPSDARKKRRLDLFLSRADNRGICRLVEGRAEREGATATARRGGTDEETRGERVRRARSRRLSVWRALPEPSSGETKSPPSESDPWVDPVDEEKVLTRKAPKRRGAFPRCGSRARRPQRDALPPLGTSRHHLRERARPLAPLVLAPDPRSARPPRFPFRDVVASLSSAPKKQGFSRVQRGSESN